MKYNIHHEEYIKDSIVASHASNLKVDEVKQFIEAFRSVKPRGDGYNFWKFQRNMTDESFKEWQSWEDKDSGFRHFDNKTFYGWYCRYVDEKELRIIPIHTVESFLEDCK